MSRRPRPEEPATATGYLVQVLEGSAEVLAAHVPDATSPRSVSVVHHPEDHRSVLVVQVEERQVERGSRAVATWIGPPLTGALSSRLMDNQTLKVTTGKVSHARA